MNEVPPGRDEPDDVDELYRRASAGDDSRPSEWVRHAVLTHAAHLAAERARQTGHAGRAPRREVNQPWRRPAIFGTLAAAALAGLLVAPHFLPPPTPNVAMKSQAPATSAPTPDVRQYAAPSAARREAAAPPAAPSPAVPPQEAEQRSSGMLAEQRPPPAATADERKLAKAGASARNETTSPEAAASLAAKNAPAKLAGTVSAQREAAAPMADAAVRADPGARLRQAAETGDAPALQRVLDEQSDIDGRDDSGRTALLLAAQHGQDHAVEVLLAHGADPNAADSNGDTPLKAAIHGHRQAIAAALQRAGAR
jgi:hypothetical protein